MRLLKAKEVAARLSIGYHEVLRLIHQGHLVSVKIPGRRSYLVDERDLEEFISANRREGANNRRIPIVPVRAAKPRQAEVAEKRGADGKYIIHRDDYR